MQEFTHTTSRRPRIYFTLRKQFIEKAGGNKDTLVCDPIVSMGEDYGLAQEPLPAAWTPATVTNKHFHVGVLDHEMVEAAVRLWNIGQILEQESAPHRARCVRRQHFCFGLRTFQEDIATTLRGWNHPPLPMPFVPR